MPPQRLLLRTVNWLFHRRGWGKCAFAAFSREEVQPKRKSATRLHPKFLKDVSAERRLGAAVAPLIANTWTEGDSMRDDKTQVVFGEIRWALGARASQRAWHAFVRHTAPMREQIRGSCASPRPRFCFKKNPLSKSLLCVWAAVRWLSQFDRRLRKKEKKNHEK